MADRLLINYATRSRPEKFLNSLNNIYDTIQSDNYHILVKVDNDDTTMSNIVTREFKNVTFVIIPPVSKVFAINAAIPHSGWDWLVNMSDDMRFMKKGWDEKMRENIRNRWGESLDFFYHGNDNYQGDKLATMSIFGREYYERFFYVYAPCYKSLSCDAEAMYVAQVLGKWHYFPEVLFSHDHPANNRGKSDALYRRNDSLHAYDKDVYFSRLNKDFYVHNAGRTPFDRFKTRRK